MDRLSPLNSSANAFISFPGINDASTDLEKFVDMDIDSQSLRTPTDMSDTISHLGTNILTGNIRRHTVGPGDVEHEQALANPAHVPINFKFGPENGPHLPINLPMLQNQPLHNFTIKNQHLLKPPTVMEASKFEPRAMGSIWNHSTKRCPHHSFPIVTGSFGRRASDGGANLQIYYPASGNNVQADPIYLSPTSNDLRLGADATQQSRLDNMPVTLECGDESNDEIQRYVPIPRK